MSARVDIDSVAGNFPVEADGLINGFGFYFRARGQRWSLTVYDGSEHGWYYSEPYGDTQFAAGWMPEDEARAFIQKAAELFSEARKERR